MSQPTRKRKSTNSTDQLHAIQTLETQLTAAVGAKSSLNALVDLLDLASSADDAALCSKAVFALYRVFVSIINSGMLVPGRGRDNETKTVRMWIQERLNSYVDLLSGLLHDNEPTLRISAIQILLSLQKQLSNALNTHDLNGKNDHPQFHLSHFRSIVNALIFCPDSHRVSMKKQRTQTNPHENLRLYADVRDWVVEKCLNVYDDLRWFFLREVSRVLSASPSSSRSPAMTVENIISILERLTGIPSTSSKLASWWVEAFGRQPISKSSQGDIAVENIAQDNDEDDWRKFFEDSSASDPIDGKTSTARLHTLTVHQHLHSVSSHKVMFTRVWLSLLSILSSISADRSKAIALRVLDIMHRSILPHLMRPVLVMDWVGSCIDYGGSLGLLALNTLFILMKDYNLDYPSFYTRLYDFLDRDLLHLKHRARFFRLTELFLSSTHLPAVLIASFIKRLSRLSLNAPPAAIIGIIPFTYNVLRRHPTLMQMVHRTTDDRIGDDDTFDMTETNPMLTNALESSLWELRSHKIHYHTSVATMASIFEEAFTKNGYTMEDFMDHTYMTIFDSEVNKKLMKEPVVSNSHANVYSLTGMWSIERA